MAESKMMLTPLSGSKIIDGTETAPGIDDAGYAKFMERRDRALAIVGLAIDPALLYLIGEPTDPTEVWTKLENQFQKKSWANKLSMRRQATLIEIERWSVQDYVKQMTEIFNALSVMDAPLSEEDCVIYLLASLPESFGVLVTALEASATVPTMDVVMERLLHEERKHKEKEESSSQHDEKAMVMQPRRFYGHCYHCGKQGHLKRDCPGFRAEWNKGKRKYEAHKAANEDNDASDYDALIVGHEALQVGLGSSWIVDSGATCHNVQ
jgi:hypothetical protein